MEPRSKFRRFFTARLKTGSTSVFLWGYLPYTLFIGKISRTLSEQSQRSKIADIKKVIISSEIPVPTYLRSEIYGQEGLGSYNHYFQLSLPIQAADMRINRLDIHAGLEIDPPSDW